MSYMSHIYEGDLFYILLNLPKNENPNSSVLNMTGKDTIQWARREKLGPEVPGCGEKTRILEQSWKRLTTAKPLGHKLPLKKVTDPTYSLSGFPQEFHRRPD